MNIKKLLYAVGCVCGAVLFMGVAGDVFKAVMTDSAGNVVSTPLSFSNNVTLNATPSADRHLVRLVDVTNIVATAPIRITSTNLSYSITSSNNLIIVNAAAATTLTLPNAATVTGRNFVIKNISTNRVNVVTAGGTIDGSVTNSILFRWTAMEYFSDGSNWFIK